MFIPQLNEFVQGIASNGVAFNISKNYCLSHASAVELATILKDLKPDIVEGPPVPNWGNRFVYTSSVPFFRFPDGKVRNAGVLATYWIWFSPVQAEKSCRADIAEDYTGAELLT